MITISRSPIDLHCLYWFISYILPPFRLTAMVYSQSVNQSSKQPRDTSGRKNVCTQQEWMNYWIVVFLSLVKAKQFLQKSEKFSIFYSSGCHHLYLITDNLWIVVNENQSVKWQEGQFNIHSMLGLEICFLSATKEKVSLT